MTKSGPILAALIAAGLCICWTAPILADEGEIIENVPIVLKRQYPPGQPSGFGPRSPTPNAVYSNFTNTAGGTVLVGGITSATGTKVTKLLADDIQCTVGGVPMVQYNFTIYNANVTAYTATPLFRFYADNANKPGTFLGGFNGAATSFAANTIGVYGALVSPTWSIPANGKMWVGTAFSTPSGSLTLRNNLGVALFDPVDVGSSIDEDYLSTSNGASSPTTAFASSNPPGTVTVSPPQYPPGNYPRNHAYEIIIGAGVCCVSSPIPACSVVTLAACSAAGGMYLGNGTTCSGLDCNGNGKDDICDLASGFSQDCNHNGIPDSCDIAGGMADVNGNGVPDVCQPDCNGNSVLDACEVPGGCALGNCATLYPMVCGTAQDCQSNGVLDSCELGPWTVYDAGTCDGSNAGGPDGASGWSTNGFVDKFQIQAGGQSRFKTFHTEACYFSGRTLMTTLRLRVYRLPTGSIPADLPSFAAAVPIFDHTYTVAGGELAITARASCLFGLLTDNYDVTGPEFDLTPPGYYAVFVNFPGFSLGTSNLLVSAADDGFGTTYQWGKDTNAPVAVASLPLAWNLKFPNNDTNSNQIPDECEVARACCFPDGHCEMLTAAACGGTWGASGSTCSPNLCPPPTGSCCASNGSCTVTSQANCSGVWTLGGNCSPNPCPQPTGSCCQPDGSCTVTTFAACAGAWTQDGTCDPNTCPQPSGACCLSNGGCLFITQASCAPIPGAQWQGFGTDCNDGNGNEIADACEAPLGSCCMPNGSCAETTQAGCTGTWTSGGTCVPNPCPCPLLGDLTADGVIDGLDVIRFVECATAVGTNCRCGDFDHDNGVDGDDVPDFVSALLQ